MKADSIFNKDFPLRRFLCECDELCPDFAALAILCSPSATF